MNPKIGMKAGNSLNIVIYDCILIMKNSWWLHLKISALNNARHCSGE
jgi:hypothetical protein